MHDPEVWTIMSFSFHLSLKNERLFHLSFRNERLFHLSFKNKCRQAFCLTVRHVISHFQYVIAPADSYIKTIQLRKKYSICLDLDNTQKYWVICSSSVLPPHMSEPADRICTLRADSICNLRMPMMEFIVWYQQRWQQAKYSTIGLLRAQQPTLCTDSRKDWVDWVESILPGLRSSSSVLA